MGELEKVSKHLELSESKTNSLEHSILSLLDKCKEFEGQLDLTQKDLSEGFRELDSRDKKLNSKRESLELTRESIERRLKEVGDREKDFALFREKKIRDLELREEELFRIGEVYAKEVDEKLSEQEKKVQELLTALKSEKLEIEGLKNFVEKGFKEMGFAEEYLQGKRREIELIQISIETRTKELEHKEGKIKERERKVELKEEELNLWKARHGETIIKEQRLQLMIEDLEFQEENNDFIRKLNEKRMKELDLKEKELEKKLKQHFHLEEKGFEKELLEKGLTDLESKRKQFEEQFEEFELRKKELQESFKEFHSKNNDFLLEKKLLEEASNNLREKGKKFEERTKQFELKEKELQESLKEFHLKQRESLLTTELLEKESKDLQSKWKEFEHRIEQFNVREKVFEESFEEFHVKEQQFQLEKKVLETESKHLESRRKQLEDSIKKFEVREKELELKEKNIQLEKELLEKESKYLESGRKELEGSINKFELRKKELELKEKQLNSVPHDHLGTGQSQDAVSQSSLCNSTDLGIRSVAMMDGKDLQIFLNEHEKDHCLMVDKVFEALLLSKDPAKLVLSAMEGYFPPRWRKGNRELSGYVVRRSCMLLLRQLIRISPQIQPCVRDDALKLAREWKTKIMTRSSSEVFGFLYLLASFDVASAFDVEDIMRWLEFASQDQWELEPELCRRLGLKEKIPSLIENLLKSSQSLEAIKFIYGFELVDCFPPVPILKNYLKHVKMSTITMLRKRCNTKNVQNEYVDTRVAAIRSVIRCIVDRKLESQFSPRNLENTIKQVLMNKGDKNFTGAYNCHGAQGQPKVNVKQISSTAAPSQPNAHCLATDLSNTFRVPSHPMAVIIANMDGKNLLSFLSSHVVEHELLHNEVSSALQISDNSPKLVLDAVESLYYCHKTVNETKSCIFLLEQLMGLSPDIMLDVKEAARKIAFDWQAKLKAKNRNLLLILMFLLLVSSYRLVSTFHGDELLDLYQRVVQLKPSPELFRALVISKDISNAGCYSEAETQKSTSKSLPVKNLAASSSTVPELDVESLCTKMDSEGKEHASVCSEVATFINHSPDPADLILDALRNCHGSNFLKNKNPKLVLKSFCRLLEQLMSVSIEIRPEVQERAYLFALDWKAKSTGPCSWEASGFLQLLATYQLSSVSSSDELFGLLEVVCQPKKASNLIRTFGLADQIPGFIDQLIKKKKLLLAFAYVYNFKLVDMFPPVALLKQHVLCSKLVAKKICNKGQNTPEAQDKAIVSEISALKTVIKLIRQHDLQSEYSPDELQSTIELLEGQRAQLKTSMQKKNANFPAPEVQMQLVETKKRPANDAACISKAPLQPANKIPRVDSRSEFIIDPHCNWPEPATSQHPSDLNVEPYAPSSRAPSRNYSSSGSPLICPPYNYVPSFMVARTKSFHPVWHNPRYPDFQGAH